MKILSYEFVEEMIKVTTDYEPRPEFVYFADKFDNLDKLKKEIEKSIGFNFKKKEKKDKKLEKLIKDLEKENGN